MNPKAQIQLKIETARVHQISASLKNLVVQERESGERTSIVWNLGPAGWHYLPQIRSEIEGLSSVFSTSRNFVMEDDDPRDASLSYVRPDRLTGARVLGVTRERKECQLCGQGWSTLPAAPEFAVTLPAPILVPGMFDDEDQKLTIVSEDFLNELARHGLERGLTPMPVTVDGPADRPYFALVAPTRLEEAQPWGSRYPERPCAYCGGRAPAHLFFPLFEKPTDPELAAQDWFHALALGPVAPIVTKRVADWLRGPGKEWASKPMYGSRPRFVRCGWDPDDRLIASLPERFQGVSDTVLEPLRPDEYPLPWPPKKARGKTVG